MWQACHAIETGMGSWFGDGSTAAIEIVVLPGSWHEAVEDRISASMG